MDMEFSGFNLKTNDISAMYSLAAQSALILHKRGALKFEDISREVHYFILSASYHSSMLENAFNNVQKTDARIKKAVETTGEVILEGWRGDVLATTFEFDSLLTNVRSVFDRLVQVLQTPLDRQLPQSINDLAKKHQDLRVEPLANDLLSNWDQWGRKAKEYN